MKQFKDLTKPTLARVYKPPFFVPETTNSPRVFLGGSIEMGKAVDWQNDLTQKLADLEVEILNPRRDDWDSSWQQDPTPGTKFHEQVTWELKGQESSTHLVYYFADDTMSPITLMELGLFGDSKPSEAYVFSTPKYQRHGNVKVVCDRYGIRHFDNYNKLVLALRADLASCC